MPNGEGYCSARSQRLASKALSPLGANVFTHFFIRLSVSQSIETTMKFEAIS